MAGLFPQSRINTRVFHYLNKSIGKPLLCFDTTLTPLLNNSLQLFHFFCFGIRKDMAV